MVLDTGVPGRISHIGIKTKGNVDIISGIEGAYWDLSIIMRINAIVSQVKCQRSQGVHRLEVIC